MSVCFYVTGLKLNAEKWDELLGEWTEEHLDDILDEPRFSEEKEPLCFVAGLGSIRGIVLTLGPKKGAAELRLSALASRKDWEWAFEIMALALKKGGGGVERETGEAYTAKNLTRAQAHKEAEQDFIFSANAFQSRLGNGVSVPMGEYSVPLTPSDLPPVSEKNFDKVEKALAKRMERYIGAFRPFVMKMDDGSRVTTWALIPTMIQQVDLVTIDYADDMEVPYPQLREILGDRAEQVGDLLWLPELSPKKDKALLEKLAAARVDRKA
ncbi:MAG TPA: hypothetical protein VEJ63_10550 [Planctomycetota bacterium]|nr:hypothetical protein [Planctomycetota bacterium]